MREFTCDVAVTVQITISDDAPEDVLTRGMDPEFYNAYYGPMAQPDVIAHWAYNATVNHVDDASRLDGWADLKRDMVQLNVLHDTAEMNKPVEVTA